MAMYSFDISETVIKMEGSFVNEDFCRVCMSKEINMKSVFSTDLTQTVEELQFCTGIIVTKEDGLPTMLCGACREHLSIAYKFKHACLRADKVFRKILGQQALLKDSIKKEVVDDNDYQYVVTKHEVEEYDDNNTGQAFDTDGEECKTKPTTTKSIRSKQKKVTKGEIIPEDSKAKKKLSPLHCDICDLQFSSKELSLEHRRDLHGCEWICEICGKQFMHRASHYSHIQSHKPPKYKCSLCDYKTWHKADMTKHIRIHTGEKHYVCQYCTCSFYNVSNLHGHIRRNHGGSKPHACPRCGRAFYSADKLRRHLDSHDNIKRYECEVCHGQFTRRCHWKKHLKKQHSIEVPQIRPGRRKTNTVSGDLEGKLFIVDASVKS